MFVELLQRLQPIRDLPLWARWSFTAVMVLLFFWIRLASSEVLEGYPLLLFFPPIILASFVFDRGSGFVAVFLSSALALYFFVEPAGSLVPADAGDVTALLVFVLVGLLLAGLMEALRLTVEQLSRRTAELERARQEAKASYDLLDEIMESTPDVVFVKDREGRFVHVNASLARIFGTSRSMVLGKRDRDFLPEPEVRAIEAVDRRVIGEGKPSIVEETIEVLDANTGRREARCFLSSKAPWIGPSGEVLGLIGIVRDITDRKSAEESLRQSDAQKAILLADINHRIKNHMMSVSALIAHTGRQVTTLADARQALEAAASRLAVLGRVYDRLQVAGGQTSVRADDFLGGLCADLKATLVGLRPIALHVQAEPVAMDATRAVTVGLIVNELVQNALKYAFPDDRAGDVTVRLSCGDEVCTLEVEDDGAGLPPDRNDQGTGTGTRLVRALAQQLGGQVEWLTSPGTKVVLSFPAKGATDLVL